MICPNCLYWEEDERRFCDCKEEWLTHEPEHYPMGEEE